MLFARLPSFIQYIIHRIITLKFWYYPFHDLDSFHIIKLPTYIYQLLDFSIHLLVIIFANRSNANLFMKTRFRTFSLIEYFLIQLFTRTQTSILYLYIRCSTQFYHALCQIRNSYRFSHVKDKDFATITLRSCF